MNVIKGDTIFTSNIYIKVLNISLISIFRIVKTHIAVWTWVTAIWIFCLVDPAWVRAQVIDEPASIQKSDFAFGMDTELGILRFENVNGKGERYVSSVLAPSFTYGDWEAGLRLRYRWNAKGLRDEDYDSASDYLSILRYVQYHEKDDPGYFGRLGDIDDAQIGYGQFINRYRNTLSLDEPSTGIVLDYIGKTIKMEGIWSNLASPEVYGVRFAARPFVEEDSSSQRHGLSIGMTLAGDLSEDARWENKYANGLPFFFEEAPKGADSLGMGLAKKHAPLTMLSFDAGLPIRTDRVDHLEAYAELGNIFGFGSGLGVGMEADHKLTNTRIKGWLEQRLIGNEFVPSYFNSRYEFDRIRTTQVTLANGIEYEAVNSKRNQLKNRTRLEFGSYVGMEFRFKSTYRLKWSLEHSWNRNGSGWFEIDFLVADPDLPFQLRYVFDRVNMESLNDILYGGKDNGLLRLEFAYMVKKHLLIGFRYRQSYESVEHWGRKIGQRKRTSIEPSFIIRL